MELNPDVMSISLESGQDMCRKDTGEMRKLRLWSRGHVFIVRSCGIIDMWKPIYRCMRTSKNLIMLSHVHVQVRITFTGFYNRSELVI